MGNFTPDKATRIRRRHEEKNDRLPTRNQPMPKIWTVTLADPKPKDRIAYYIVNPGKVVNLKDVADKLAKLYGMTHVWIYESLFGCFEVYLEHGVECRLIEEMTLKALNAEEEVSPP